MNLWTRSLAVCVASIGIAFLAGCSQQSEESDAVVHGEQHADHDHDAEGHDHGEEGHNLHGYWCSEHGVPEEICAQCDSKLAAEFQKKGDWCEEHNRPDSQCFIHHPELEEKFIAQYEAKYGEKPPKREAE